MKTACRPEWEDPSEMTAKATFFCLRMDWTQPWTSIGEFPVDFGAAMSWRMVEGREEEEE